MIASARTTVEGSTPADLSNRRWLGAVAAGILAGTLLFAYTGVHGPICFARVYLHVPCPGCGLTRSLQALWHADLLTSVRYHPLGLPLFILCALLALRGAAPARWRPLFASLDRFMALLSQPRGAFSCLVLLLGIYAVRVALALSGNHFFTWD